MIAYLLILFGILARFLPHLPNFAPIAAVAIFAGFYSRSKWSFAVPVAAMLISDFFIGFYYWPIMLSVYFAFGVSGILGAWLRKHKGITNLYAVTLSSGLLFYLITNFAVWAFGTMYVHSIGGLAASYINALPFFRNSILGDIFYVSAIFGVYELALFGIRRYQASKAGNL